MHSHTFHIEERRYLTLISYTVYKDCKSILMYPKTKTILTHFPGFSGVTTHFWNKVYISLKGNFCNDNWHFSGTSHALISF